MKPSELIRKRGLCKKYFCQNPETGNSVSIHDAAQPGCDFPLCLFGALLVADYNLETGQSISGHGVGMLADRVREHLGDINGMGLTDWNDAPERTADEVASTLEAIGQ